MDDSRFDTLTRSFTGVRSRRGALGALLGGTLGSLGMVTEAKKKKKKKKKKRSTGTLGTLPPPCVRNCTDKTCGDDGCGGSCGGCSGGSCTNGRCVCPFGQPCSPGVCCPNGQTCWSGSCAACPAEGGFGFEGHCGEVAHRCGTTPSADCICMTSIEGTAHCGLASPFQLRCSDCTSDAECDDEFPELPPGSAVCVNCGTTCEEGKAHYCVPKCSAGA